MKCYKNSTHNVDIIFNQICLFNIWVKALHKKIKAIFGKHMPGIYIIAAALPDMFLFVYALFILNLAEL